MSMFWNKDLGWENMAPRVWMLIWPCVVGYELPGKCGACQGSEGLLCSLLQVSQIHLPGKIWAREVGLMPGALSPAFFFSFLPYFCFHPSGSRTMHREEVIGKKAFSFSFTQYRGVGGTSCQPLGLLLLSLFWNFIDAWGEKKICSNAFLLNWIAFPQPFR